jgi:hypothetical protein
MIQRGSCTARGLSCSDGARPDPGEGPTPRTEWAYRLPPPCAFLAARSDVLMPPVLRSVE